ncbi:hypothetical protein B0T18DRAFT_391369 [Schizothecium vesticola]|uniref:Uncharacterized protein n=1 Tax=Schizothecium vesticola TaxID=314040 RepID=A0AA40K5V3_9PEZI|nr:hypothetical protein B0T18DRAFT_391369 [Schizothecium vesticola]
MGCGGGWDSGPDPDEEKEPSSIPSPIDKDNKEPDLTDKEADTKQLQKVHNRPPPEQIVGLPASGKLEDAKFKDPKKYDDTPLNVHSYWEDDGGSCKRDDGTGNYGFGSGPPITKQERGGAVQEYKPAKFKAITAPPVFSPAAGRIVELEDGDALGEDGGGGAPGAPGGSGAGSAPGGGNGPAPV